MTPVARQFSVRRPAFVIVAVITLTLLAGGYCLNALLDEQRSYGPISADYLLLTPPLIRQLPIGQVQSIAYGYSAADGPKPSMVSVEFIAPQARRVELESAIGRYLTKRGFVENSPGLFAQARHEVTVEATPLDGGRVRFKLVDLDYLD